MGLRLQQLQPQADLIQAVKDERERRLACGFDYDFGAPRGVHRIGTTRQDLLGWDEVTDLADALRATGQSATAIDVLTDTGLTQVVPNEWAAIQIAAGAFRQPIWAASFAVSTKVAQGLITTLAGVRDAAEWELF